MPFFKDSHLDWKTIPDFSSYKISENGVIKRIKAVKGCLYNTGKNPELRTKKNEQKYYVLTADDGTRKQVSLDFLLLLVFNKTSGSEIIDLPSENWLDVVGWEGYYKVSNKGRLKRISRLEEKTYKETVYKFVSLERLINPSSSGNVGLCRGEEKPKYYKIAQLMLRAFKGEPPDGKYLARHLNDNPQDNILENLEWGDHKDNYEDSVRNGTGGTGSPGAIIRGNKIRGRKMSEKNKQALLKWLTSEENRQLSLKKSRDARGRFIS